MCYLYKIHVYIILTENDPEKHVFTCHCLLTQKGLVGQGSCA